MVYALDGRRYEPCGVERSGTDKAEYEVEERKGPPVPIPLPVLVDADKVDGADVGSFGGGRGAREG